jgi:ubiquinone/menaquinone biosynthesis C-methylase UbiE
MRLAMNKNDRTFAGSLPAAYQRYLVPLIFEPFAEDLATRASREAPRRILEIAAGTGVVSRALARHLPGECAILATDLSQPMLDIALSQTKAVNITFGQADAQNLPFDDGAFDMAVCQFGVMFFPDKPGALAGTRRVLKPGGRYLFNVWDRIEANDFAHAAIETLAGLFPVDPPRFLERVPHGFHDKTLIEDLLHKAGFKDIAVEIVRRTSRADSAMDAAIGYCQGTPLRGEIEAKGPDALVRATDAVASAIAKQFGAGAIEGRIQAIVVSARR